MDDSKNDAAGSATGGVTVDARHAAAALQKLQQTTDVYSDVVLKGTDGVKVPAIRCLLAAQSPVFHRMLYGDFAEANKTEIEFPYSGALLSALVTYIFTGNMEEIAFTSNDDTIVSHDDIERVAAGIVGLTNAAAFFDLPDLVTKATAMIRTLLQSKRQAAVIFLSVCESRESEKPILDFIRANPTSTLENNQSIASLSAEKLELIMKDPPVGVDDFFMFKVFQYWMDDGEEETTNPHANERKSQGTKLLKHITLERIEPRDLSSVVAASGLFPMERMYEAFKAQALIAVEKYGASYAPTTSILWEAAARGHSVFMLECTPLRSGICSWKVRMERKPNRASCVGFGVASTAHALDTSECLGFQKGGWVYYSYCNIGYALSGGRHKNFEKFDVGAVLLFTLDLTEGGTLSVSIDGGNSFVLFTDMNLFPQLAWIMTQRFAFLGLWTLCAKS